MEEKENEIINVEKGACYTFTVTTNVNAKLVLHTAEGDIDIEYSVKNKTLNVNGSGCPCSPTCVTDCSVETATIIMVELKNWHKQFPAPHTLPAIGAMYNIMLVIDSQHCSYQPIQWTMKEVKDE